MFSAYTAGRFTGTDTDGIPKWEFNNDDKTPSHVEFGYDDLIRDDFGTSVTIFILPGKITEFQMFGVSHGSEGGKKIDGSDAISNEIQKKTFDAGKAYKLTIRRAQKNTNSRSIAMSVRCVSE